MQVERRKKPRVRLYVPGRYIVEDRVAHECTVVDASASGLALYGPASGSTGEKVVVYVDDIGRFEGRIVRHFNGGMAIEFTAPSRATLAVGGLAARQIRRPPQTITAPPNLEVIAAKSAS